MSLPIRERARNPPSHPTAGDGAVLGVLVFGVGVKVHGDFPPMRVTTTFGGRCASGRAVPPAPERARRPSVVGLQLPLGLLQDKQPLVNARHRRRSRRRSMASCSTTPRGQLCWSNRASCRRTVPHYLSLCSRSASKHDWMPSLRRWSYRWMPPAIDKTHIELPEIAESAGARLHDDS